MAKKHGFADFLYERLIDPILYSSSRDVWVMGISILLALLIVGFFMTYLVLSGRFNQLSEVTALAVITPTSALPALQPILETPKPTDIETPKTPTSQFTATPGYQERLRSVSDDLTIARTYLNNQNFAQAIPHLDVVLAVVPEHGAAYYMRAQAYMELIRNQRFRDEYLDYLHRALSDLDQAIAIGPATGDMYLARNLAYDRLAGEEPYRVDSDRLKEIALENLRKAIALGNSDEFSPRVEPHMLYLLGRCDEGLDLAERLMTRRKASEPPSGGLNRLLALGNLCEGQLDEALAYIDTAINIYPEPVWKFDRAIILYSMGSLDEAVDQITELINEYPYYCACRYFLRAVIYVEQDKLDLAQADINYGWGQTWGHWGIVSYAQAKLALKQGDLESGIPLLQYAEATISRGMGPIMMEQILQELAQLNVAPLAPAPFVTITVTPIPE